jgi:hypothetical protein
MLAEWQSLGMPLDSASSKGKSSCWTCPNRPNYPVAIGGGAQIEIGYQYYGGITRWVNDLGTFTPAASPVKTTTSKPGWVLAADLVTKAGNSWSSLSGLPAHKNAGTPLPAGANEVFIDGSARWFNARALMFVDTRGSAHNLYIYQDDLGVLESKRSQLRRVQ